MDGPERGWLARLLAPTRNRILLAVGVALLIFRIALPFALRPLLVAQADAALAGRIELADLDLSLLRGGLTLHDFSVHSDERPSDAPALFAAKRLWAQISWLALLTRTVEVEEFELEGFDVRLDRFKDGLLLPRPIASETPPETAEEEGAPRAWSVAADAVSLRAGHIALHDHTLAGNPAPFELGIDDFTARELAIRSNPADDEPGRIAIEAKLEQGSVSLAAWIKQYPAGLDVRSTLVLEDLPIGKLRAYLPMFGWSDLSGSLGASIEHRYEPGGVHEIRGRASLANVRVDVPRFEEPALAWQNLEVVLDRVDLVKHHAEIDSITSTGVHVLVDPRSKTPLTVLAPPADEPVDAAAAPATAAPVDAPTQATHESAEAVAKIEAPSNADAEATPSAWTWRVKKLSLAEAVVDLRGAKEPVPLAVHAVLDSLSSELESRSPLSLSITSEKGTVAVDGQLAPAPFAFEGKLVVSDLALPPLLTQVDAPALYWLRDGTLRANLALSLAKDLRLSGSLGLAGLDLEEDKTAKQFGIQWKDLEIAISELALPDVMGGEAVAGPRSLDVQLARIALAEPRFVVTRDKKGIVLPPFSASDKRGDAAAEGGEVSAPAPTEATTPAQASPTASASPSDAKAEAAPMAVSLVIADARISGLHAKLADRAVEPFYRGRIETLDLHATGVRWPAREVESIDLTMEGLRGAKLSMKGAIVGGQSTLEGQLVELPLEQFNPYLGATGYSLRAGGLSVEAKGSFQADQFETRSKIVVSSLDVGGAAGESAFQQNFGIPISIALGLLKDLDGKISLAVPVAGQRDKVKLGFGRIVSQALRKALVGALASPLKLLGAATHNGKVERLAPLPIAFEPGATELSAEGAERVEEIAGLLAASPGITLVLTGQISLADQRVLRERDLLAELEAQRGVRALAALGEMGTRRAVRDHLERELAGTSTTPLSADDARWLEAQIEKRSLPASGIETLASERASQVRNLLASEHGIAGRRLTLAPPILDSPAPESGVAIALGAVGPRETTDRATDRTTEGEQ